jgi:TolB-like protein/DNA-binding winged helix-turn-helix (wHTH) protein/tetratricopeptide (TPR) repeat protein
MTEHKSCVFRFADIEVREREFCIVKNGEVLAIEPKAFRVLVCLIRNPGQLVSKDELLDAVWNDCSVSENSLTQCIARLRRALGDDTHEPHYIATVPTLGYRFLLEVQVAEDSHLTLGIPAPNGHTESGATETNPTPTEDRLPRPRVQSPQRWAAAFVTIGAIVIVGIIVIVAVGRFRNSVPQKAYSVSVHSLAVLPFENLSGDTEQEYFADGMTAELITELAKISSIRVISRTSVMRYKRIRKPLIDIARELNVDAVVEGEVLRSQNRVRVTAQLVDASTDRHLWSETYDRDLRDVVSLQADVAQSISKAIGARVTPAEDSHRPSTRRIDPEAYEAYLKGRFFYQKRTTAGFNKAADYFRQAVRIDPRFAEAYAGLAKTYDILGTYGILPPNECFPKAREAADKALQLDDTLSEAYTARGTAWTMYERDWSAAEQDFQRALKLNPNDADAHHLHAEHLTNIGRAEGAIAEMARARELDPLSLPVNGTLGRTYRDARRNEEADVQCRKTVELDPDFALGHWCLGVTDIAEKRYTEALTEMQRANALGEAPLYTLGLGYAYAVSGDRTRAEAIIKSLEKRPDNAYTPAYYIASIYGALGEKDMAFTWLQRAYAERDPGITYLLLDPFMDPLRSDPRFDVLVRQVGFPH